MSAISLHGPSFKTTCGYCKREGFSFYSFDCAEMQAADYQGLMDRGWSRAGTFFYKPDVKASCCRLVNIRLDVTQFQPNLRQAKVMQKFEAFLDGGRLELTTEKTAKGLKSLVPSEIKDKCEGAVSAVARELGLEYVPEMVTVTANREPRLVKHGMYTLTSAFILAHALRKRGEPVLLRDIAKRLANCIGELEASATDTGYVNIKAEASGSIPLPECSLEAPRHCEAKKYECALEDDTYSDEKYQLYARYQMAIHDDPSSTSMKFERAYCSGPLKKDRLSLSQGSAEDNGIELGAFHLTHRVDGRLIAFSVIDIVPFGLNSEYFIYDPELRPLSLGIVGALKEIEFVAQRATGSFKYYYMGYYLDNCAKMRYKADYAPSELLCQETFRWVPYSLSQQAKDTHEFIRLVDCLPSGCDKSIEPDMDFEGVDFDQAISSIKLKLRKIEITMGEIDKRLSSSLAPHLKALLLRVGLSLIDRFVVVL